MTRTEAGRRLLDLLRIADRGPLADTLAADWAGGILAIEAEARADCETRLATLREVVACAVEWVNAHDALTIGPATGVPDNELLERYSDAATDLLAVVSQNRAALAADPDEETT